MITWTNRDGFIDMAAKWVQKGGKFADAVKAIGQYCEPYKKGEEPNPGKNQLSRARHDVAKKIGKDVTLL